MKMFRSDMADFGCNETRLPDYLLLSGQRIDDRDLPMALASSLFSVSCYAPRGREGKGDKVGAKDAYLAFLYYPLRSNSYLTVSKERQFILRELRRTG